MIEKEIEDDTVLDTETTLGDNPDRNSGEILQPTTGLSRLTTPQVSRLRPIPSEGFVEHRSVSHETMRKYSVWTSGTDQYYPYYKGRVHVSNKIRTLASKGFLVQGPIVDTDLFGQQLFPPGGKYLTITEGELDALSAYQMFGSEYPTVSVKGASSAERDVTNSWEYVNSFDQIVLCFDRDEPHKKPNGDTWFPGQEAALRVAALFPIGKVRICTFQKYKDANDYLVNGASTDFKKEWWRAPVWTPAGLHRAVDMWEVVAKDDEYETQYYPWQGLNDYTYGIRLSEMVTINAPTGIGKTQLIKEMESCLKNSVAENVKIGTLHLEETNKQTLESLMSITANKPLHIPPVRAEVSKEELKRYFDETFATDHFVVYDHFGSTAINTILTFVRHMAAMGCRYIFLDHLSIIVSDQNGDERKQLDEISTKLKTLCMELNIAVICIIHQNRQGEIRGTAGVEQLSNIVLKLVRNKEDPDEWRRNVIKIIVQKNRFCGKTGSSCWVWYDTESGRLLELSEDQAKLYENGGVQGNTGGFHVQEDFKNWNEVV